MVKVEYPTYGDRGELLGDNLVGYFVSKEDAQAALRGLCPWDFNDMWGPSSYKKFRLIDQPGTLTTADTRFLKETADNIRRAKKHARGWKNSWHERAPLDWK